MADTPIGGWRISKKPFTKAMAAEKMRPMNQARMVEHGMDGSSRLLTTARTSE
jgi:hypothetical protein